MSRFSFIFLRLTPALLLVLSACRDLPTTPDDSLRPMLAAAPADPAEIRSWYTGDGHGNDIVGGHDALARGAPGFAPGLVGQAFGFDGGNDDYYFVGDNPDHSVGTADLTLEFWIRTTQVADPNRVVYVFQKGVNSRGGIFRWSGMIRDDGTFRFGLSGASGGVGTTGPVNDGSWHHVAMVREGSELRAYLDGTLQDTNDPGFVIDIDTRGSLLLGSAIPQLVQKNPNHKSLDGLLDEVTLWREALTGPEIQAIVNAASDGKDRPSHLIRPEPPILIPYLSEWEHRLDGRRNRDLVAGDFSGGGYTPALGGFGTFDFQCAFNNSDHVNTAWSTTEDLLLRRELVLTSRTEQVLVIGGADDGLQVFMNGTEVTSGSVGGGGCAWKDQIVTTVPSHLLVEGTNILEVAGRDIFGSETFLDVEVRTVATPVIPTEIDIKPGSDPNSISLEGSGKGGGKGKGNGGGRIPVAVLTDTDLDASEVDATTVTLGDEDAPDTPVATRNNGSLFANLEDVNGDGRDDLVLHFGKSELIANQDLTSESEALCLNGQLADDTPIRGCDAVRTVP